MFVYLCAVVRVVAREQQFDDEVLVEERAAKRSRGQDSLATLGAEGAYARQRAWLARDDPDVPKSAWKVVIVHR